MGLNEDFLNELGQAMQDYIQRMYNVTTEVTEDGDLYERYLLRDHPFEVIRKGDKVFELNLN